MRKSKLTEKQLGEIEERMTNGESARALAREFGAPESTIRAKLSARVKKVKVVANQVLIAEEGLESLDFSARQSAVELSRKLKKTSVHLADASLIGARVAGQLLTQAEVCLASAIASGVDVDALRVVVQLLKSADDAARIPMSLLALNKDMLNKDADGTTVRLTALRDDDFI